MVKRTGNLYEEFISKEHWKLAAEKALKGKKKLLSVKRLLDKGEDYIEELRQQVIDGTFEFRGYTTKTIYEPKERKLYIARLEERIYHWACMMLVERIFEPVFIHDSYSCRKGKGQHRCSLKCMELTRNCEYALKLDMRKFYPSIDQEIMKKRLAWKIKDKKFLEANYKIIDSFRANDRVGVPIGNYSSQIYGNIYMTPLDYFIKEKLGCKYYARYCDDLVLGSNDKKQLKEWKNRIVDFIKIENNMTISRSKIQKVSNGVDFVGYLHFKEYKRLRKKTARKIFKRTFFLLEKYFVKEITAESAEGSLASAIGWCRHANTYHFRLLIKLKKLKNYFRQEVTCNL